MSYYPYSGGYWAAQQMRYQQGEDARRFRESPDYRAPMQVNAYGRATDVPSQYTSYFRGLDPIGQAALEDPQNYLVGYGQAARQVAPVTSNLYRYLLAQAGRLRTQYDYETLRNPTATWLGYLDTHLAQQASDFAGLPAQQRGEGNRFAWQGGRFLG